MTDTPQRRTRKLGAAAWLLLLLLSGMAVTAVWGFWWEPGRLVVREHELELPGWPDDMELRVTVISDLHVGSPRNDRDNLRRVVRRVNETLPDIVIIPGDLTIDNVVGGRFVSPEDIASDLSALTPRFGVFAVLGNHDRWLSADRVTDALTSVGISVLENRNTRIRVRNHDLWIAGVADYWTGHPSIDDALDGVDAGSPVLLFTHNPDLFPEVPDRVSLTIGGHTHGGQVRVPFVGRLNTPSRFGEKYAAGHIVEEGRHLFVTTGVGTSRLGVRFMVPPEIAALRLTSASDAR